MVVIRNEFLLGVARAILPLLDKPAPKNQKDNQRVLIKYGDGVASLESLDLSSFDLSDPGVFFPVFIFNW